MTTRNASELGAELATLTPEQYEARKTQTARFAAERPKPTFDADRFCAAVERRVMEKLSASSFTGAGPALSQPPQKLQADDEDGQDDEDEPLTPRERALLAQYQRDDVEIAAAARKALGEYKRFARHPAACRFTSMGAAKFIASHPEVIQAQGGISSPSFRGRR